MDEQAYSWQTQHSSCTSNDPELRKPPNAAEKALPPGTARRRPPPSRRTGPCSWRSSAPAGCCGRPPRTDALRTRPSTRLRRRSPEVALQVSEITTIDLFRSLVSNLFIRSPYNTNIDLTVFEHTIQQNPAAGTMWCDSYCIIRF